MKAVILAAGRGQRMQLLTVSTPKPLLKVNGKPIIDYILGALPEEIDEIIIVIDYLGNQISNHVFQWCDENSSGIKKIQYVQGSSKGNAYSFLATRKYLKDERFLLMYGDEIPNPENVKRCLEKDLSILTFDGGIYDGVMVLNTDIFECETSDGFFKTMVEEFVYNHVVNFIPAENFIGGINTPTDIVRVEEELKMSKKHKHIWKYVPADGYRVCKAPIPTIESCGKIEKLDTNKNNT